MDVVRSSPDPNFDDLMNKMPKFSEAKPPQQEQPKSEPKKEEPPKKE